jgi:hypothetical protein
VKSENDGTVLTSDFQETRAELYENGSSGPATADLSNWLAGGEEGALQIMTDEEIINNLLEDDNSENEQESSTPPIIRKKQHASWRHLRIENSARKCSKRDI